MRSFLTISVVAACASLAASRPQFNVPRVLAPLLSLRGGEDAGLPTYPALTVSCKVAEQLFKLLLPLHNIRMRARFHGFN